MEKKLPIFFVHRGAGNILKYALNQAKKFNPDSEICLLGDESNMFVSRFGIRHIPINENFSYAEIFAEKFVNMSPNPAGYELFCFQRWFALAEYLEKRDDIEDFVYFDTDVMLYCDVTEYASKYFTQDYDISVCRGIGPQYTFFRKSTLYRMCEFMKKYYHEPSFYGKLCAYYDERFVKGGDYGGICDMTLLGWFAKEQNTLDTNRIADGAVFDNSINRSEGFVMKGKMKKVVLSGGLPYGILESGERIRFLGLHFQGAAKWYMYRFYTGDASAVPSRLSSDIRLCRHNLKMLVWKPIVRLGLNKKLKELLHIKPDKP